MLTCPGENMAVTCDDEGCRGCLFASGGAYQAEADRSGLELTGLMEVASVREQDFR